jgi:glycosyltransferase involved in cell wall biosynthesis
MKVMQVVADGSPGGGTTNVLALAEDLLGQNVEVVVCSQRDSYALREARRMGAQVCEGLDFFRSRLDTRVVTQLQRAVASIGPDIVHTHGGRAAFAAVRGSNRTRLRRTIYTVRGYQFWRKRFPLRFLARQAERRISRAVFKTVHVSKSDQDVALHHWFVNDVAATRLIRNGIRLSDIPLADPCHAASASARKQVAVLGRLTYPKNPHLVLDIARVLAAEGFVFHLIGGGELESAIRRRVEAERIDNVILHGNQSRAEGLQLMSRAGTFLMASLWEGLPIAPVEAMAMGLAVVISDVNGCTEVVRDGIEGRVAPSENLAAFVSALRAVVAEPAATSRMIENGKLRVAQEFTRERVVREHLELYRACLAEAS